MGFGKKKPEGDADLEAKKSALFGGFRSKKDKGSKTSLPASNNPYANGGASTSDPYAQKANPYATQHGGNDPYAPQSQSSLTQPPTSSFGSLTLNSERGGPPAYRQPSPAPNRYEKSPVPQGGYGGGAPRYPANGSQGQASGYGSDPYGGGQSRYGAGGYGGLGRSNSQDTMSTDAGRNALFGDAAQRAQQQPSAAAPQPADSSYSNTGGYDSAEMPGGYGAPAELTEEQQEDNDVKTLKDEMFSIKKQDVGITRNAVRVAEQAEATGRDTLARLGIQGERIHNTERNLDMAQAHNRQAELKSKELKNLNRSMWAVHMDNPFTKEKNRKQAEDDTLRHHRIERERRDATTKEAYSTNARHQAQQRDMNGNAVRAPATQRSLADRAKYQFEADSEDDEMENEIDDNLEALSRGAKSLNFVSKAIGDEIDSQNKHLDRITTKTDKVDDQIALNRHRLNKIH